MTLTEALIMSGVDIDEVGHLYLIDPNTKLLRPISKTNWDVLRYATTNNAYTNTFVFIGTKPDRIFSVKREDIFKWEGIE